MKEIRFKLTGEEEYQDFMKAIENKFSAAVWEHDKSKPTSIKSNYWKYPTTIKLEDNFISFTVRNDGELWQIGQNLSDIPKTALQELCDIPQNDDGSITISPELQAKLVVALRGGKE